MSLALLKALYASPKYETDKNNNINSVWNWVRHIQHASYQTVLDPSSLSTQLDLWGSTVVVRGWVMHPDSFTGLSSKPTCHPFLHQINCNHLQKTITDGPVDCWPSFLQRRGLGGSWDHNPSIQPLLPIICMQFCFICRWPQRGGRVYRLGRTGVGTRCKWPRGS